MKIVKVLFLDNSDFDLWYLGEKPTEMSSEPKKKLTEEDLKLGPGKRMEVIEEKSLAKGSTYDDNPLLCKKIKQLTESGEVNLVVIGNNRGAGVKKAEAVADKMKAKTIITWYDFDLRQKRQEPYEKLGFQHFCDRKDLRRILKKVLGIKEKVNMRIQIQHHYNLSDFRDGFLCQDGKTFTSDFAQAGHWPAQQAEEMAEDLYEISRKVESGETSPKREMEWLKGVSSITTTYSYKK